MGERERQIWPAAMAGEGGAVCTADARCRHAEIRPSGRLAERVQRHSIPPTNARRTYSFGPSAPLRNSSVSLTSALTACRRPVQPLSK